MTDTCSQETRQESYNVPDEYPYECVAEKWGTRNDQSLQCYETLRLQRVTMLTAVITKEKT